MTQILESTTVPHGPAPEGAIVLCSWCPPHLHHRWRSLDLDRADFGPALVRDATFSRCPLEPRP